MSKRNIAYIKPKEPAFLKRLKQQIGYKEGPNVDTKREKLPEYNSDDSDHDDQPTVVVLKPGDLTAEEAEKAKKEAEEAPADLRERVIFRKVAKKTKGEDKGESSKDGCEANNKKEESSKGGTETKKRKKEEKKAKTSLLSFNQEEEEED